MKQLLSLLDLVRLDTPGASDAACVDQVARNIVDELGISAPPVDVEMVASYLDVQRIVPDGRLDVSGCLLCGASGTEIRVRLSDGQTRQRFTIAHECTHIFFPGYHLATQYRCSPELCLTPSRDLEALCDFGASRLLMPEGLFQPDARATAFSLASIVELADTYHTSLTATAIQYVRSRPDRAAFLVFERRQKPAEYGTAAEPLLRLQWSVTNGKWPHLPRHKSVDDGDVFDRAEQGEIMTEAITTIRCLTRSPIDVAASAILAPYVRDGAPQSRVLALLGQAGR